MPKTVRMTDSEYLSHGGCRCPFCSRFGVEWVRGHEYQCLDCGHRWREVYELAGYAEIDDNGDEIEDDDE